MWGLYKIVKLGKRFYRTIGADSVRKKDGVVNTVNETIDPSVFERYRADPSYRPIPLLNWAKRRRVDPHHLSGVIDVESGKPL